MILVTVGSQKFQFNRLLKEVDRIVENGKIGDKVFAQIGYSDYKPKYYDFKDFLKRDDLNNIMKKCNKVITHSGTGAIIGALKQEKKVIAVPRLKEFGEHIDDHQLEITYEFKKMNLIWAVLDIKDLEASILNLDYFKFNSYVSNTDNIINSIDNFINKG